MQDANKTKQQLIQELAALRRRVAELEPSGAEHRQTVAQRDAGLEALRSSEAQYRTTLDALGDMIHVVDDRLRIVLANDALKQRTEELGLETDVVGKTIYEAYPFLPQGIRAEYAEVFKSGRLLVTEERTQVGGREFITETRKIPACEGGKVTQIITVMQDITEHKRVEEALRLLEAGMQCATDAIIITLASSTRPPEIVYVNPAFSQMTGYTAEELAGQTVQVLKGPKTDLSVARRMAAAAAQGEVFEAEWILYRRNGTGFDTEMRTAPIRDAAGNITHTVSVLRDITERKRAEAALKESEQRSRQITASLREAVWLRDIKTLEVLYVNPAYETIWGRTSQSLIENPTSFVDPICPEDKERVMQAIQNQYHGVFFNQEYRITRPDGSLRWVWGRTFPIENEAGEVYRVVAVAEDITERKQAEEKIRRQAETLAALHETALGLAAQRSLSDLMQTIVLRAIDLLKAKEGSFFSYRLATDDLERTYDYNVGLESGPQWSVLRRGEGVAGRVLESGRSLAVDDYNRWGGRLRHYESNFAIVGVPIYWSGQPLGVVVVSDDAPRIFSPADVALLEQFTPLAAAAMENSRLLRDLQQQMDRLTETQAQLVQAAKLAAVGELAAGVAHELNNPLTSVLGFTALLLNATPPESSTRHDLEIVANQARRARDIVRNLLGFARQTKPQQLPANVNQLFRQTLDLVRQLLEKSGVVIEEDYAPDLGFLTLDAGQMKQVFLNLITNAAHAMPKGGKLRVHTACLGDEVAIAISDTGGGMPPEVQERIFEPFFTTKPVGQGTGLGLSISLGIVREHGGRIAVESQAGQGSTFTVWLPVERGGTSVK
jgi:PAS domain S-box-containing protein